MSATYAQNTQRGFTILELSIVLIIVGLLVGGILTGYDLIRSAELRRIATDVNNLTTAINTFQAKYDAKPGDLRRAQLYLGSECQDVPLNPCNGNQDGFIHTSATEGLRAWQHLSLAGMIDGTFSGTLDGSLPVAMMWEETPWWDGAIISTAHAKNHKVTICHKGKNTLNVSKKSLKAHLAHGDTVGSCEGSGGESGDGKGGPSCSNEEHASSSGGSSSGGSSSGSSSSGGEEEASGSSSSGGPTYDGRFAIGVNVPSSSFSRDLGYKIDFNNGHLITIAAERFPVLDGAALTPHEAWQVDTKLDDGIAHGGYMVSGDGGDNTGCTQDTNTEGYVFDNGEVACQLHFWMN